MARRYLGYKVILGLAILGSLLALRLTTAPTLAAPKGMSGTIRISGAWALYPMVVQWGNEFHKLHPNVRVDVQAGGAGKGAADALGGLVDIGMVSRDIHPAEIKKGGLGVPVVKDAVIVTASAANPLAKDVTTHGLKRATFAALWMEGASLTWGQALNSTKRAGPVRVYTRSDACGAAETWAKYLGGKQEDLEGTAVYGDPGVADAVRKDALGIGYNNLNFAYDARTGRPVAGLIIVPIDINGNGKLDKDENFYRTKAQLTNAIASGVYPSPPARDLYLLTKGKPRGVTAEFIRWILTDGQKYVDGTGYIQLPQAKLNEGLKKLK